MRLSALNLATASVLFLVGCGTGGNDDGAESVDARELQLQVDSEARSDPGDASAIAPEQEAFWSNLELFCGRAFAGEATNMREGDARRRGLYEGYPMVAHFRQCLDGELRIPGHMGEDRSRTWILTQVDGGLDLRHDHREEDGSDSETTMYGAATSAPGTALRQEFTREGQRGYWVLEIVPGERFSYGNHDGDTWLVRFDFDLNEPVDAPPAPWGWEDTEADPDPRGN